MVCNWGFAMCCLVVGFSEHEHLTLWCLECPGSRTFRARVQHMGRGATSFQRSLSLADGKTWAQEIVLGHVKNASHIIQCFHLFQSISIRMV